MEQASFLEDFTDAGGDFCSKGLLMRLREVVLGQGLTVEAGDECVIRFLMLRSLFLGLVLQDFALYF